MTRNTINRQTQIHITDSNKTKKTDSNTYNRQRINKKNRHKTHGQTTERRIQMPVTDRNTKERQKKMHVAL